MGERTVVAISLVPVVLEATTRVPAFWEKSGRFAEMMAKFPSGAISPELYMSKLGEALGPDALAGVLLAIGTFLSVYIGIHVISALISRGAEAVGGVVEAVEEGGGDSLDKPMQISHGQSEVAVGTPWVYPPSSDEQMQQKVVQRGHEKAKKAMSGK